MDLKNRSESVQRYVTKETGIKKKRKRDKKGMDLRGEEKKAKKK